MACSKVLSMYFDILHFHRVSVVRHFPFSFAISRKGTTLVSMIEKELRSADMKDLVDNFSGYVVP